MVNEDQANWATNIVKKQDDLADQEVDRSAGLLALKQSFDKLYYKVRKPVGFTRPPNWGSLQDDTDFFENPQNYKFEDHIAD